MEEGPHPPDLPAGCGPATPSRENVRSRSVRRTLRAGVFSTMGLLAAILVSSWIVAGILVKPCQRDVGEIPDGLRGNRLTITSLSGNILRGWYLPGRKNAGAIALMHGVRSDRRSMIGRARFLSEMGFTVLLFDFQGHGESSGDRVTFGFLESLDAAAAVGALKTRCPGERVGILGVSLGGVAALLASPPPLADCLVLESVYSSIDRALANRLEMRLGIAGRLAAPLLSLQMRPRLGIDPGELRPIDRIRITDVPKLILAGTEDRRTTIEESREIFAAAAEPKTLWEVEGAGHVDFHSFRKEEYEERVGSFLREHLTIAAE